MRPMENEPAHSSSSSTLPEIFIIDDDPVLCQTTETLLIEAGYSVASFCSGSDGLNAIASSDPKLVILDLSLPDMTGIAFLRRLPHGWLDKTKVLVITGFATVPATVELMTLGAVDVVEKPVFADELRLRVDHAMGRRSRLPYEGSRHGRSTLRGASADLRIREVLRIIDANIAERSSLSLTLLARAVGLSPTYLCRLFKREVGDSLSTFMRKRRVARSIELLERTQMTLRMVAKRVGYGSESELCRDFKLVVGMTPRKHLKDGE